MSGREFVSYRISSDVLAEIFSANGIGDREFGCSGGVQCAVDGDSLIFAAENGAYSLAQLMVLSWRSSELAEDEMSVFESLADGKLGGGIADVTKYRLKTPYNGTDKGKLELIAEIFANTDAQRKLDAEKIRSYTVRCIPSYWKEVGSFGFVKEVYFREQLSCVLAVPEGMDCTEENAVLILKDGELRFEDKGGFVWNDAAIAKAVQLVCQPNAAKGAEVIAKVSCREVTEFCIMSGILEIADGAFKGCDALKTLTVMPRFVQMGRDMAGSDVKIVSSSGSTAEKYAREHGVQFECIELPERTPMDVCIAAGVELTADSAAAYRFKDSERAMLNDLEFEYADGTKDELDCEIIDMTSEKAREAGIIRQLESFGRVVGTETVRNDRSAYIKVSLMQSAKKADVYSCFIEIDRNDRIICIHTEKEFTAAQLAVSGQNSMMYRFLSLASSVKINGAASDQFVIPEQWKAAPVAEVTAEPVVEVQPEPVAEVTAEPVVEIQPEPVAEVTAEPVVETQPESVAEVTAEPVVGIQPEPVAEVAAEPVVETQPEPVAEVTAEPVVEVQPEPVAEVTAEPVVEVQPVQCKALVRGERFDLGAMVNEVLTVELDYEAETGIDIDGYLFLLGQNGKVRSDEDLVFFGQKASPEGAVKNDEQKTSRFTVELSKLDSEIARLAVAFAIYGEDDTKTFARVSRADVNLYCKGEKICTFRLEGLSTERSTVAAEIYNKGGWKLKTVGLGYKEALKSLCNSFGVQVQ
ncbi:MAG: TerD family protein [Ruminococcus sp.]|nr:TerD family protein [Ruminococcus sp.]